MISGRSDNGDRAAARVIAGEAVEEHEPVAKESRGQEMTAHMLLAAERACPRLTRVSQHFEARLRALLDRADQPPRLATRDLGDDAADAAGDDRPALPERL